MNGHLNRSIAVQANPMVIKNNGLNVLLACGFVLCVQFVFSQPGPNDLTEAPILFADSCVRRLTAWTIEEQASRTPDDILPAFIGSGYLGAGLDASGMQNLDCNVSHLDHYRKPASNHTDDLYLFHERMISDHLSPKNLMPLGYLDYELSIDGKEIDILSSDVVKWHRLVHIKEAFVKTTLSFRQGVLLSITAFCPYERSEVYFRFEAHSLDGKEHGICLRPRLRLHLRNRSGAAKPVFDQVAIVHRDGTYAVGTIAPQSVYQPLEDYTVVYAIFSSPAAAISANEAEIAALTELTVSSQPQTFDVGFWIGSSAIQRHRFAQARNAAEQFAQQRWEGLLTSHQSDYAAYYEGGGTLSIGDTKRQMLYNQSLYLFRSGSTFRSGLPLQLLLFHPECWFGGTFWDTVFVADGLLLANHL